MKNFHMIEGRSFDGEFLLILSRKLYGTKVVYRIYDSQFYVKRNGKSPRVLLYNFHYIKRKNRKAGMEVTSGPSMIRPISLLMHDFMNNILHLFYIKTFSLFQPPHRVCLPSASDYFYDKNRNKKLEIRLCLLF